VNAHLWEFPNLELSPDDLDLTGAAHRTLGVRPRTLEPLATIKHSITRYRITLEAYRVPSHSAAGIPSETQGRWLGYGRLQQLAFTSAHKQILRRLRLLEFASARQRFGCRFQTRQVLDV
jgi:A/G-specific adenine glycosylase